MLNVLLVFVGTFLIIRLLYVQKAICKSQNKWMGLILPTIFFFLSIIISVPNFEKAFYIQFSIGAFIASILVLLFYNLLTIALFFIYWRRKRIVL